MNLISFHPRLKSADKNNYDSNILVFNQGTCIYANKLYSTVEITQFASPSPDKPHSATVHKPYFSVANSTTSATPTHALYTLNKSSCSRWKSCTLIHLAELRFARNSIKPKNGYALSGCTMHHTIFGSAFVWHIEMAYLIRQRPKRAEIRRWPSRREPQPPGLFENACQNKNQKPPATFSTRKLERNFCNGRFANNTNRSELRIFGRGDLFAFAWGRQVADTLWIHFGYNAHATIEPS